MSEIRVIKGEDGKASISTESLINYIHEFKKYIDIVDGEDSNLHDFADTIMNKIKELETDYYNRILKME